MSGVERTKRLADVRLEGERVVLRPVVPADAAEAFPLIHARREVLRWLIWKGRLRIESKDRSVELGPGDFTVIPRGTVHSPLALEDDTVVIIFNRTQLGMDLVDESVDLGGFELPPESQD